jgi:hypothetical protein
MMRVLKYSIVLLAFFGVLIINDLTSENRTLFYLVGIGIMLAFFPIIKAYDKVRARQNKQSSKEEE